MYAGLESYQVVTSWPFPVKSLGVALACGIKFVKELWRLEWPLSRAPYPYKKAKYCSVLLVGHVPTTMTKSRKIASLTCKQGGLFRKRVKANPRLKINRIINVFHCFCSVYFEIIQTQNGGQNNIQETPLQIYKTSNENVRFCSVSVIGLWTTRPNPAPLLGLVKSTC